MSVHIEWFNTDYLSVEVVPAGTEFAGYDLPTDTTALVISGGGNGAVIEGEPIVLAQLLREAADQLWID